MSYWKWDKWIPKEICEHLIQECSNEPLMQSEIQNNTPIDTSIRKSKNLFLKRNHWFEGILFNHIRYANQSLNLNFDITDCQEVQYTVYTETEFYDWHTDQDYFRISTPMRKLSAVCQLNDTSEFTGGGLVIKNGNTELNVLKQQGDIVVFPSGILHKALPIESGTRIVAVMWATGPAFK